MDDIVIRGMARWPNVPAVYGWLALDRRGGWLLKGDPIANPAVTTFIGRNYAHDELGRWYFQNGPQRVFVDLEYTPLVYRLIPATEGGQACWVEAQDGRRTAAARAAYLDETGALLLDTSLGVGIVHDRDLDVLASKFVDGSGRPVSEEALEEALQALLQQGSTQLRLAAFDAVVEVHAIAREEVEKRFGFVAHPSPDDDGMPG